MDEIIISPNLIRKLPPLHEMSEYYAELKQWMGKWFPDKIVTDSDKKNNLEKNPGLDLGPQLLYK